MGYRSDVNTTVATAIQRIGDLFATTLDFYFWMILFCGDEFKSQLAAVQFSILATPSAAVELRRSYDNPTATRRLDCAVEVPFEESFRTHSLFASFPLVTELETADCVTHPDKPIEDVSQ